MSPEYDSGKEGGVVFEPLPESPGKSPLVKLGIVIIVVGILAVGGILLWRGSQTGPRGGTQETNENSAVENVNAAPAENTNQQQKVNAPTPNFNASTEASTNQPTEPTEQPSLVERVVNFFTAPFRRQNPPRSGGTSPPTANTGGDTQPRTNTGSNTSPTPSINSIPNTNLTPPTNTGSAQNVNAPPTDQVNTNAGGNTNINGNTSLNTNTGTNSNANMNTNTDTNGNTNGNVNGNTNVNGNANTNSNTNIAPPPNPPCIFDPVLVRCL